MSTYCHADGEGPCLASCCPIKGEKSPMKCPPTHDHVWDKVDRAATTDILIHNIQADIESSECYLVGNEDGMTFLRCERDECMELKTSIQGIAGRYWWTENLPYECLPEFAVLRRAKHLATHTDDVVKMPEGMNWGVRKSGLDRHTAIRTDDYFDVDKDTKGDAVLQSSLDEGHAREYGRRYFNYDGGYL